MKKKLFALLLVLAVALPTLGGLPALAAEEDSPAEAGTASAGYIVKLRESPAGFFSARRDPRALGGDLYVVDTLEEAMALAGADGVEYIEPNYSRELFGSLELNDPYYLDSSLWNLDFMKVGPLWGEEEGQLSLSGQGITVAVIDSGLTPGLEDLEQERMLTGYDTTQSPTSDGYHATVSSYYHGSFVTGVIAATANNGLGVAGVAPKVNILPLNVGRSITTSSGKASVSITDADVLEAIELAVNYVGPDGSTVDVINMSLGGPSYSQSMYAAIQAAVEKGILVVAAAGNDGNTTVNYPAGYDNVVGVAAVAKNGSHASYSNSNSKVWISAPGTYLRGINPSSDTGYGLDSGTSFATPCVAGLAALTKQYVRGITQAQFMELLKLTADDRGDEGKDDQYGYGTVNGENMAAALPLRRITYVLNGGSFPEGVTPITGYRFYSTQDVTLSVPLREGYVFAGWYADEALTGAEVAAFSPASDALSDTGRTYYAKWLDDNTALTSVALLLDGEEFPCALEDGVYKSYFPHGTDLSEAQISALPARETTSLSILRDEEEGRSLDRWTVTATSESGSIKSYTVEADTSLHAPALIGQAAEGSVEGGATPPSLDGLTPVEPYAVQLSDWFADADEDDVLLYTLKELTVTDADGVSQVMDTVYGLEFANGELSYTPAITDVGKILSLQIVATDGRFSSPTLTVTLTVGPLPFSRPTAQPSQGTYDLNPDSPDHAELEVALTLYGAEFSGVLGPEEEPLPEGSFRLTDPSREEDETSDPDGQDLLSAEARGDLPQIQDDSTQDKHTLFLSQSYLDTLSPGAYDLTLLFAPDVRVGYALTVVDTTPLPPVLTPAKGSYDRYQKAAAHAALTLTFPTEGPALVSIARNETPLTPETQFQVTVDEETGLTTVSFPISYLNTLPLGTSGLLLTFDNDTQAVYTVTASNSTPTSSGGGGGGGGGGGSSSSSGSSSSGSASSGSASSGSSSSTADSSASSASDGSSASGDTQLQSAQEAPVELVESGEGGVMLKLETGDPLTQAQSQALIDANAQAQVTVTAPGLEVILPAGSLREGDDLSALLPDLSQSGDVVMYTSPDGVQSPVLLSRVEDGQVSFVAPGPGSYALAFGAKSFPDVKGHWAEPSIAFASARALLQGMEDDRFLPDRPTSRAAIFTILSRMAGEDIPNETEGPWYSGTVAWAVARELTDGSRPEEDIDREELVTLLWRWAGSPQGGALSGFPDAGEVSSWAREAVAWAAGEDILHGRTDGSIDPHTGATRAETAILMERFLSYLLRGYNL